MDGKPKEVKSETTVGKKEKLVKAPRPIMMLTGEIKSTNDLMTKLISLMETQHSADKQAIANVISSLDNSGESTMKAMEVLFAGMNKSVQESNELLKKAFAPATTEVPTTEEVTWWKSKPVKIAGGIVLVATAFGLAIYFADEIKDFFGFGNGNVTAEGSGDETIAL
jgi:hypothetical protein